MELSGIKGIGNAYLKKLNTLGIFDIAGLVGFLPVKYIDFRQYTQGVDVAEGQYVFLKAEIKKLSVHGKTVKAQLLPSFWDGAAHISKLGAVWFNQPYIKDKLTVGKTYNFFAKASDFNGVLTLPNPVFEDADEPKALKGIMPIYKTKGLISQTMMRKFIKSALEYYKIGSLSEYSSVKAYTLSLNDAYKNAHLPDGVDDAFAAQRQIATEDFVRLIFTYKALKRQFNKRRTFYKADKDILKGYFSALPFALTVSQKKALDDIIGDMTGGAYMNRLLMGDVGSGKTAVAFAAAYFAIGSGSQCAFIAPTELLARQHYKAASELLGGLGIKVVILTAACAASEKKYVTEAIKSGEAQLIIGTHSLFSENVIYGNLRLVIIDEQHRFGVKEKDAIIKKASEADVLTLSATPIPRALSLALLSELDVSVIERRSRIDDMISTKIVPDYKRNDMFAYIRERAVSGRQAYIVAPRIEDAEGVETDTVKALYKELKEGLFNDIDIAVLHGKSLKADKQAVMDGFNGGSISVLICTTVIEVGIDVKNASVMAVMNAENYGLAALHQLRGRVGRGTEKSYCFLHTTKDDNARLTVLAECGDGFAVSERDFDMRGGGNFLGEKQSGSFENLNNYAVKIDKELISEAKLIAEGIELNKETLGIFREMNYQKYYNIIKNTVFN